jgi:MerR family copper efflux transcriptional regulator
MQIGTLAARSGVPAKTIRYYEEIGLIPEAERTDSGYRAYAERDVALLRFVNRARSLGFGIKDVRLLLTLYLDRARTSADVKRVALDHIAEIERKMAELESIRRTLIELSEKCHGDERPDCPIIDDLAGTAAWSADEGMRN